MQTAFQLNKNYFPSVAKKPQSIKNVFELIRQKKAEFARELQQIQETNNVLPVIHNEKRQNDDQQQQSFNEQTPHPQSMESIELKVIQLRNKQGTDPKKTQKSEAKKISVYELSASRKNTINDGKNRNNRTKTQFTPLEPRKLTGNTCPTNNIQKLREQQIKQQRIQDARKNFERVVETVPKNMKDRNEDNLLDTVSCLQIFNPFFFRNQRIVNTCLLKMGRIIMRDSHHQLYKTGETLEHFYIILAGKVKIADGFVKRVCQTGQTVLEQVLFAQKGKKAALQRAKVLGPTYLLEFHLEQYKKLKQELIRYGLKMAFHEMQAIIKRNHIIKNWMRNKRSSQARR